MSKIFRRGSAYALSGSCGFFHAIAARNTRQNHAMTLDELDVALRREHGLEGFLGDVEFTYVAAFARFQLLRVCAVSRRCSSPAGRLWPVSGHRIEVELRRDVNAIEKLLGDFDGGLVEPVDHLPQAHATGDVLACEHVLFFELCQ